MGNLIIDPAWNLDPNNLSNYYKLLDQNLGDNRAMGFSDSLPSNLGAHPGGIFNMQYFTYYTLTDSTGLYAATTDTLGYLKAFHVLGDNANGRLECFTRHFPEDNKTFYDGTYTLPYRYTMRAFHGDWLDASKLYRSWLIDSPLFKDEASTLRKRTDFLGIVNKWDYGLYYLPDTTLVKEQLAFFLADTTDTLNAGGRLDQWGRITPNYEIDRYFCKWYWADPLNREKIHPWDYVRVVKQSGVAPVSWTGDCLGLRACPRDAQVAIFGDRFTPAVSPIVDPGASCEVVS
jgi:hypothetical protein